MTANGVFITGTDTEIGKTWATVRLMSELQNRGLKVNGMKPVASGCEKQGGKLRNDDAIQIQSQSSASFAYDQVNPYAFAPPIAPHFAAAELGVEIQLSTINACYSVVADGAEIILVEGAGGWSVPLGDGLFWCDIVKNLGLQVVLVVGMRLGCINHALLTARAIQADGCSLLAWVANQIDPEYSEFDATVECLRDVLPASFLGVMLHNDTCLPDCADSNLDLSMFDAVSF